MPQTEAQEAQRNIQATNAPAFGFEGRRNRADAASLKQETVFRAELSLRSTVRVD